MKTQLLTSKSVLLTIALLFGAVSASMATSYTASTNGNWSNANNWGGNAPGFITGSGNRLVVPAGVTLMLDSDLVINGELALSGGTLNLNGQNLTINGDIVTTGAGSIIGNKSSDVTFNGYGGAGNIVFSSAGQIVKNLTINIGSNDGVFLGSALTVAGTLSLENGFIGIGNTNLTIAAQGNVAGGSSSSYVVNTGTGSLIMTVPNSGSAYVFQVGTQNGYAPVVVTNNSATTGSFSIFASEGVLTGGCTGINMPSDQSMVNTSWSVTSSITDANVNLEMFWNTNMQVNGFSNTEAYMSQYTAEGWSTNEYTTATLSSTGSSSLQMIGVTSFSQYAVFGKNTATVINTVSANTTMRLYPNPATSAINLTLAQTSNFPILKIYDVTGKEISTQQIESSLTTLDVTNLTSGVYFASVNGNTAQKFIKE